MSTTTIMPSIGPAPPNLPRTVVPEAFKPRVLKEADAKREAASNPPPPPSPKPTPKQPQPLEISGEKDSSGTSKDSALALSARGNLGGNAAIGLQVSEASNQQPAPPEAAPPPAAPKTGPRLENQLSEDEKSVVKQLKARDQEVRTHEAAHASVGRGFAGSPQYEYASGPDGQQYAVGGHVEIDVRAVPNNPEATIEKMEVIQKAALAPARPSSADRAVAAAAAEKQRAAEADLREARKEAVEDQRPSNEEAAGPDTLADGVVGATEDQKGPVSSATGNAAIPAINSTTAAPTVGATSPSLAINLIA